MKDEEFGLGINDYHKNLIFDFDLTINEVINKFNQEQKKKEDELIKRGIQIALDELIEQDRYYEKWDLHDLKYELGKLLQKDNFD